MGAGLVALALQAPPMSDRARLCLCRMALVAHDRDDPPTYWAGWPMLATHALGFDGYTPTAERAIARAVAELIEAKQIEVIRPGSIGRQAEYALRINPR